jgi:hypothetical protein
MENMTVLFQGPVYLSGVMDVIGSGEWLVHNFNVKKHSEALNPAAYLFNSQFDKSSYIAFIDLNVFQFLVNAVKKDFPKDLYRTAVAYLTFLQIAEIEVDPTYAMYEKVNHDPKRAREAVEDLDLFYKLNNMPTDQLANYAIGESSQLLLENSLGFNEVGHIEAELTKYQRLKEWPSLYVIVLAVVRIEFDSGIPRQRKLSAFIEWSFREFRHSLPGFVFAVSVLGRQKLGRAMKYSPSATVDARRASLTNMTWDLYYIKQYFQRWVNRKEGEESLFLTNDKAFALILGLSIDIQKSLSLNPIEQYLTGLDRNLFEYILYPDSYPGERVYSSNRWGNEYRDEKIAELERELLSPIFGT